MSKMSILALQNHRTPFFTYEYYESPPALGLPSLPRFLFYFVVALVTAGHECSGLHNLLHTILSSKVSSSLADQCHALDVEQLSVSVALVACLLEGSCNILGHWTAK